MNGFIKYNPRQFLAFDFSGSPVLHVILPFPDNSSVITDRPEL
jgi:hypothetical protein